MIVVENLSKSYGGNVIFDGIGFSVGKRERVGLLGRNGHGKTTLFRMIMGEESVDAGQIIIPKNYILGMVRQDLTFTKTNALDEALSTIKGDPVADAWKAEKVLLGLGFSHEQMQLNPYKLSGGYQVRLNMVKAFVAEPDMLLLDEPTNFLDITSIRWLEDYLKSWPGELMIITHDRSFMDQVVTHTLGIHRRKIRKLPGDTGKYYQQIAQDEEVYERTRQNDEKRKKEIELFISRFRAKARLANMVQSRIKTIAKMEKKDKLQQIRNLEFSFSEKPFEAKQIFKTENLSFGYDEHKLIDNFSFTANYGEKICVVGPNGRGKSTLLKLIAGKLEAQGGSVTYHGNAATSFFAQEDTESLHPSRTVEEEILYSAKHVDRQQARNICGAMLFSGDDALKKISVLSGGEKSRVMLGKVVAMPANVLLLDEPTNHLDMESADALLEAIDSFDGTVVMVTHNEMFLHALADRLIVFQGGKVKAFDGNYAFFLEKEGWETEARPGNGKELMDDQGNKKELRQKRSEIVKQKSKELKPWQDKAKKLENTIEKKEQELTRLNQALIEASNQQGGQEIARLSPGLAQCQAEIDQSFEELEKALEQCEILSQKFDLILDELK